MLFKSREAQAVEGKVAFGAQFVFEELFVGGKTCEDDGKILRLAQLREERLHLVVGHAEGREVGLGEARGGVLLAFDGGGEGSMDRAEAEPQMGEGAVHGQPPPNWTRRLPSQGMPATVERNPFSRSSWWRRPSGRLTWIDASSKWMRPSRSA